ncbi:MAG: aminopeptidase P family protein [Spirochaetia bacterium]|nr:aminopeptidase P family protein [Spirochaetia bacterium]
MIREKIDQLTSFLQKEGIDTYLILSREDSDVVLPLLLPVHVVAQTAFFFRSDGLHYVITGKTDAPMYEEFGIFDVLTVDEDFEADFITLFSSIDIKKLALNISEDDYLIDGLTVGQYLMLEKMITKELLERIECSSDVFIREIRARKSNYEIKQIEIAVTKTCNIYAKVREKIAIGMSETEIGDLFIPLMKEEGVINAFDEPYSYPLICINRCGLAHRKPNSNNIFQEGDILIIDFSVKYNNYCSDIARSFYALRKGETHADEQSLRAFRTTVNAVSAIIENIRVGMKGWEVDTFGRSIIEGGGYPTIRHASGHQLGQQVHDGGTTLSFYNEKRPNVLSEVQLSEVYAIEPTVIQDDNNPSFIVEENIVITEGKARVLSERQTELYYISRTK